MKKILYTVAMVAGLAVVGSAIATPVSINYGSSSSGVTSGLINFNGSSGFYFSPDGGGTYMLQTGSGDLGYMGTGVFTIGATSPFGIGEIASVTGSTTLTINGAFGNGGGVLTGTLTWINLIQQGTGGNLNLQGNVNLTGVSYSGGTDSTLIALASGPGDVDVLNFSFTPADSLDFLKANQAFTQFSGSISSTPDGGATVMLLGAALSAMGLFRKKLIA